MLREHIILDFNKVFNNARTKVLGPDSQVITDSQFEFLIEFSSHNFTGRLDADCKKVVEILNLKKVVNENLVNRDITIKESTYLQIARELGIQKFAWGEYIFRQGDQSKQMYILIYGEVVGLKEPLKTIDNNEKILKNAKEFFYVRPGSYFGELALKSYGSRPYSVKWTQHSYTLTLSRSTIMKYIGDQLTSEIASIAKLLKTTQNFSNFDENMIDEFSKNLSIVSIPSKTQVIEQGEELIMLYIIKNADVSIKRNVNLDNVDFNKFPMILQKELEKLPKMLEIEVLSKKTPGDVFWLSEILSYNPSYYSMATKMPSKFFIAPVTDFVNIFKDQDISKIPFTERLTPSDESMLRYYIEQFIWNRYKEDLLFNTQLSMKKKTKKELEYLNKIEDETANQRNTRKDKEYFITTAGGYFKTKLMMKKNKKSINNLRKEENIKKIGFERQKTTLQEFDVCLPKQFKMSFPIAKKFLESWGIGENIISKFNDVDKISEKDNEVEDLETTKHMNKSLVGSLLSPTKSAWKVPKNASFASIVLNSSANNDNNKVQASDKVENCNTRSLKVLVKKKASVLVDSDKMKSKGKHEKITNINDRSKSPSGKNLMTNSMNITHNPTGNATCSMKNIRIRSRRAKMSQPLGINNNKKKGNGGFSSVNVSKINENTNIQPFGDIRTRIPHCESLKKIGFFGENTNKNQKPDGNKLDQYQNSYSLIPFKRNSLKSIIAEKNRKIFKKSLSIAKDRRTKIFSIDSEEKSDEFISKLINYQTNKIIEGGVAYSTSGKGYIGQRVEEINDKIKSSNKTRVYVGRQPSYLEKKKEKLANYSVHEIRKKIHQERTWMIPPVAFSYLKSRNSTDIKSPDYKSPKRSSIHPSISKKSKSKNQSSGMTAAETERFVRNISLDNLKLSNTKNLKEKTEREEFIEFLMSKKKYIF